MFKNTACMTAVTGTHFPKVQWSDENFTIFQVNSTTFNSLPFSVEKHNFMTHGNVDN